MKGHLLALASTIGCGLIWLALTSVLGNGAMSVFLLAAIFIAGRSAGPGPAATALLAGLLPYAYVQYHRHEGLNAAFFGMLGVYLGGGLMLVLMARSERKARQMADASAAEAAAVNALLEQEVMDRRLAEQAVRERHERLELALETGHIGAYNWELATGRTVWSPTMSAIYGYPREEVTIDFEESLRRIHPDDLPIIQGAIADATETAISKRLVYRVIGLDGAQRWVEGMGKTFFDEQGKLTRVIGFCVDITERKEAELKLHQSEERFRQLALMAPVGISQSDATGQTFFANDRFQEILGLPKETLMNHGWQAAIHPDDVQSTIDAWRKSVAAGKDFLMHEFRVVHPDGALRWAIGSAALLRNEQGQVVGQIGALSDITEHKEAELALRSGREQLQQFIDNAPSLFYSKDMNGRYLLVNQRFLDSYEFSQERVLGHSDFELFPAEFARRFTENDNRVRHENRPLLFEEYDAAGKTFISVKFPLHDRSGAMVAVGGVTTDITERKKILADLQIERELLRNIIALQENEKRLLCCEFHDGVLQYVTGAKMLLEARRRSDNQPVDAELDTAIDNLRRAAEDGRQAIRGLRPPALDDAGLVAGVYDLIHQPAYADLQIEFAHDDLGRLPELIETTFYRVAQESLNNAKKHSGSPRVDITLRQDADALMLEVRDFGCGFDPTQRGSGRFGLLGMSERLRMLGGECAILSEPQVGTRVQARAPFGNAAGNASQN
jgi:PAS domain S-box-containing protein